MDTADTHIYYDISIFNNDISGAMPVNLNFNEIRSGGALINNPSNYLFSIVRFEIDKGRYKKYNKKIHEASKTHKGVVEAEKNKKIIEDLQHKISLLETKHHH